LGLDLSDIPAPLVLTPHSGEMAALLGIARADVDAQRLKSVLTLAGRTQAVVVLKGDDTLVADPHGVVGISRGGAPGLATAGSGDVLGGVIGALLARGADAFEAACAGVRIHVEAGRLAAMAGAEGILASDIASSIPQARASLGADQRR
ncbi:MAG: NAD(P)H-hydrate dehydratase, partial [Solirubrobacterales bacterium]|nr:NAD(P)H-hydrate dehydratase [Solirubrobacterales bacterium]